MTTFTISDMEHLTGVRSHTIRMWETRNKAFVPLRNGKNRLYTTNDLRKALYFSLLSRSGYRISHLVKMPISQLASLCTELHRPADQLEKVVFDLILCMYELDTDGFHHCLADALKQWPVPVTMEQIIYPFLIKSKLVWKGNRLTEEHFVVTSIRNKMIMLIEQNIQSSVKDRSVLLFLPAKGQLDLMLLYTHYQAKRCGNKILYMGNDVSLDHLAAIVEQKKPDYLFTYLNRNADMNIETLSGIMQQHHPACTLLLPQEPGLPVVEGNWNNVIPLPYSDILTKICAA